jgi:hypothetical protein
MAIGFRLAGASPRTEYSRTRRQDGARIDYEAYRSSNEIEGIARCG